MKKILLLFLIASALPGLAQKTAEVNLELLDGNIIKGTSTLNDIELITAYGKLLIPVSKVNHIDIGIGRDNDIAEKAKTFLKLLSSGTVEETRKGAYADLIKLGIKAIPAINDYLNDPRNLSEQESYSGELNIDNALNDIKAAGNLANDTPIDDVISLENNYTIGGSYHFNKLEVKTEYGNLTVPKEKIKSISVSVTPDAGKGEYVFKLSASKNISSNTAGGWLKTGINLKSGQRFTINATGEVSLASLSNTKYKPDGSSKAETAAEWNKPYGSEEGEYSSGGYASYGQVVYRIGENSVENLKAGAKFNGVAKTTGMLLISIFESVYNPGNKGTYSVRISLQK